MVFYLLEPKHFMQETNSNNFAKRTKQELYYSFLPSISVQFPVISFPHKA
jgi:hypothetical protein